MAVAEARAISDQIDLNRQKNMKLFQLVMKLSLR